MTIRACYTPRVSAAATLLHYCAPPLPRSAGPHPLLPSRLAHGVPVYPYTLAALSSPASHSPQPPPCTLKLM
jgi:hypothetical protein